MSDIDAILSELADIDEKLETLPADAFNERITLHDRKTELRAEVARLSAEVPADRPTEDVEAELASLEHRLAEIKDERIDVVEQSGGGDSAGPGAEGLGATGINRQIEEAEGAPQIRDRIKILKDALRERGVDPDQRSDWA